MPRYPDTRPITNQVHTFHVEPDGSFSCVRATIPPGVFILKLEALSGSPSHVTFTPEACTKGLFVMQPYGDMPGHWFCQHSGGSHFHIQGQLGSVHYKAGRKPGPAKGSPQKGGRKKKTTARSVAEPLHVTEPTKDTQAETHTETVVTMQRETA